MLRREEASGLEALEEVEEEEEESGLDGFEEEEEEEEDTALLSSEMDFLLLAPVLGHFFSSLVDALLDEEEVAPEVAAPIEGRCVVDVIMAG